MHMITVDDLIVGYTYARTNANGEKLSPVTPKEGTLFYHKTLIESGVVYERYYTDEEEESTVTKPRLHIGDSTCESCEG